MRTMDFRWAPAYIDATLGAAAGREDSQLMSDTNTELIRRFYERLNSGDLTVIDEFVSDEFVEHGGIPGQPAGKAGLQMLMQLQRTTFGNLRYVEAYAKASLKKYRPIAARKEVVNVSSGLL